MNYATEVNHDKTDRNKKDIPEIPTEVRKKLKFKYPLVEWKWTKEDVKRYLKEKGFWIKEYDLFPHTGCFLCPYQTKKAWLVLKTHYPELFKIALRYHYDNLRLIGLPIIPNGIESQKAFEGLE